MLRGYGLLLAGAGVLLAGCVGDEFLVGGGGSDGTGGATSTGTPAGSTGTDVAGSTSSVATSSSTGTGGCAGCLLDGECVAGTAVDACGAAGAACQSCTTDELCQTASCDGQACGTTPANDGDPCPFIPGDETSGRCTGGVCEESPENCLNGVDDDEDGDPDCLDADCNVAFTCAANTPEGWQGPIAVYVGAVECPGVWGTPAEGEFGIGVTADDYECVCEASVDGCDDVTFDAGSTPLGTDTCSGGSSSQLALAAGGCVSLGNTTDQSFALGAELVAEPSCEGSIDEAFTLPPASFQQIVTVCQPPVPEGGVGCDAGTCRPRVPDSGGVQGAICISRAGDDNTCPAPFTARTVIATELDDTRDCDCTCSDPSCGAAIGFYDEATCAECDGNAGTCAELGFGEACEIGLPVATPLYAGWEPAPTADTADLPIGELAEGGRTTICCLN